VPAQKPREIAVAALQRRERAEDYIENIFARQLEQSPLPPHDRGLAQELTYGVVRWQATLDWLIGRKTAGRTQKRTLQILLRLGLYQLFWLERIPDHAAVHETVEMAKQLGYGPQAGFVNALLRGYLREQEVTKRLLEDLRSTQPSLGFSHPEWLHTRWEQRWGVPRAAQLMAWNNTPPRTFARVNTLRTDAGKLLQRWREEEDVEYDLFPRSWIEENLVFVLKSHPPIEKLRSFQEGWFYVQDPSTLLAVQELNPAPGDRILDLCSAPGGKTTFMAQRLSDRSPILAQDISAERLELVRENCARLGVTNVQTELVPAEPPPARQNFFDRILLDAPCSNTGVMQRRVDLRWRLKPEEIERLRKVQLRLLTSAALQLRLGGTLVYSTCSLEPEENRGVVDQFLTERTDFRLEAERELLPFQDGTDGAFVARLMRLDNAVA
jgi:16S rRNA (cytosine967-C5)-methyltransferase